MTETAEMLSASLAYEKLKKSECFKALDDALTSCAIVYGQDWHTSVERVLAGAVMDEILRVMKFANELAADLSVKTVGLKRPMIVGPIGNDQ